MAPTVYGSRVGQLPVDRAGRDLRNASGSAGGAAAAAVGLAAALRSSTQKVSTSVTAFAHQSRLVFIGTKTGHIFRFYMSDFAESGREKAQGTGSTSHDDTIGFLGTFPVSGDIDNGEYDFDIKTSQNVGDSKDVNSKSTKQKWSLSQDAWKTSLDDSTHSGVCVGTRPVEKFVYIPECSLLLVLCDGRLLSLDPDTLAVAQTVIKAKCRDVCTNELDHFYHQICASVGVDKLVLFEHKNLGPGTLMQISQVTTRSPTLLCRWNGPSMCLANSTSYWMVDQDLKVNDTHVMWHDPASSSGANVSSDVGNNSDSASKRITLSPGDLIRRRSRSLMNTSPKISTSSTASSSTVSDTSASRRPLIQSIPVARFVVAGLNNVGVVLDASGNPSGGALAWSCAPLQLAYQAPCNLVSLLENNRVEIHTNNNTQNQFLVTQTIDVAGGYTLVAQVMLWRCQENRSNKQHTMVLGGGGNNSQKGGKTIKNNRDILLANPEGVILRLDPVPIKIQICELLSLGKTKQAGMLLEQSLSGEPDRHFRTKIMRRFHVSSGIALLKRAWGKRQIDTQSNGSLRNNSGRLPKIPVRAALDCFVKARLDPREVLCCFKELLWEEFRYLRTQLALGETRGSADNKNPNPETTKRKAAVVTFEQLLGRDDALNEKVIDYDMYAQLLTYLIDVKTNVVERVISVSDSTGLVADHDGYADWTDDEDALTAIDTAILKLCIQLILSGEMSAKENTSESGVNMEICTTALQSLIMNSSSHLDARSAISDLHAAGLYHYTALMYVTRNETIEALKVWAKLGTGELVESGYKGALSDTLACLEEHIGDANVWEHARWVFDKAPDKSISVFTRHVDALHVKQVLKFLHTLSGYKVHMYAVRYMEAVVAKQQELEEVVSGSSRSTGHSRSISDDGQVAGEEEKSESAALLFGSNLGEKSWNNTQLAIECLHSIHVAGRSASSASRISTVLVNLLRTATEINCKALFDTAQRLNNKTVLVELHARKFDHEKALAIILSSPSSSQANSTRAAAARVFASSTLAATAAESYCLSHRTTTYLGDPWLNPFHVLLRLLFSSSNSNERTTPSKTNNQRHTWTPTTPKGHNEGVRILDKLVSELLVRIGAYVEPAVVLDLVPSSTCLSDLLPFLRIAVPAATHRRHELHLETGLHRSHNLQTRWEQASLNAQSFVLERGVKLGGAGREGSVIIGRVGERDMHGRGGGGNVCGVCRKPMEGRVFARIGVTPAVAVHLHCTPKT